LGFSLPQLYTLFGAKKMTEDEKINEISTFLAEKEALVEAREKVREAAKIIRKKENEITAELRKYRHKIIAEKVDVSMGTLLKIIEWLKNENKH